jgi:hypothetical protein
MATYIRIEGGEKNKNSGKKWTEEELKKVFELFMSEEDIKIHENNSKIQNLANELQRTTRSVEAQLLMFRNLNKHGDYSYGNMNKLCKKIWFEYLKNH